MKRSSISPCFIKLSNQFIGIFFGAENNFERSCFIELGFTLANEFTNGYKSYSFQWSKNIIQGQLIIIHALKRG